MKKKATWDDLRVAVSALAQHNYPQHACSRSLHERWVNALIDELEQLHAPDPDTCYTLANGECVAPNCELHRPVPSQLAKLYVFLKEGDRGIRRRTLYDSQAEDG